MSRILVMFGTTHGQTAKVALAISDRLRVLGHQVAIADAAMMQPVPDSYDGVVVAASLHLGAYQPEVVEWVLQHHAALNRRPTAFISLCLGVLEHDAKVDRDLRAIMDAFLKSTGWQPAETVIVAGALKYTRYNPILRWLMKLKVRKAGGDTDTSRDYEYTDWLAVEAFADRVSQLTMPASAPARSA